MYSTRREALRSFVLLGGTLVFSRALTACAVDADHDGTAPDEGKGEGEAVDQSEDALVSCKLPVISANHGHSLVVSAADVAAGKTRSYSIAGTSSHDHTVTISTAQFAALAMGKAVSVLSTNGAGHTHTVTVTCSVTAAPVACGLGAKASVISANHGHSLIIAKADVAAGVAKTYSIRGSASHDHQVSITAAQLTSLKSGKSISVASSSALAHVHTVTVICA